MSLPIALRRLTSLLSLLADRDIRRNAFRLRRFRSPAVIGGTPEYLREIEQRQVGPLSTPLPFAAQQSVALNDGYQLASRTVPVITSDLRFEDPEDVSAVQRFAWLLPRVVGGIPAPDALKEISGWILRNPKPLPTEAWQTYTIAERLMNWTLCSMALRLGLNQDPQIAGSMLIQLRELAAKLEYYGEELTGNHLSNDGRALYCAGHFIGDAEAVSLGRAILLEERRRLFEERGFHREGSTHYQFLITRNYCEALWFASAAGDEGMVDELSTTLAELAEGCRLFRVGRDMALIGDISPDCTPSWLLRVPEVADQLLGRPVIHDQTSGWHRLFADAASVTSLPVPAVETREWGRLDAGPWTIFTHANRGGSPRAHAHQDSGGILVFFEGEPLVVECARRSYMPAANWSRGHEAHSILSVDGLDPAPWWHWIYGDELLSRLTGEVPTIGINGCSMEIRHGGFRRRRGVGIVARKISVPDESLVITDLIEGSGHHRIDLTFHVTERVERDQAELRVGRFRLTPPKGLTGIEVISAPQRGMTWGWGAARYGDRMPLTSIRLTGRVRLPWQGQTRVRPT